MVHPSSPGSGRIAKGRSGEGRTKGPGVKEKAMDHHLREIADRLDEVLRLQSRVMELTEQVAEAAGMNPGDRTLRGRK